MLLWLHHKTLCYSRTFRVLFQYDRLYVSNGRYYKSPSIFLIVKGIGIIWMAFKNYEERAFLRFTFTSPRELRLTPTKSKYFIIQNRSIIREEKVRFGHQIFKMSICGLTGISKSLTFRVPVDFLYVKTQILLMK